MSETAKHVKSEGNKVECVKIAISIGGSSLDALVDSCASVSIVSLKFINKYQIPMKTIDSINILSIFGTTTPVLGKSAFRVRIGPRTFTCKALVLEDPIYPILLGLDWLLANKCKINFDDLLLEFPDGFTNPIRVKKEMQRAIPVRSKQQVILQSGERALVPVRIPGLKDVQSIDGIIFGINSDQPWKIARALIRVQNGISIAEITNMGRGPWKIGRKQQLGWFEYNPNIANTLLIASAIEMEDVPSLREGGDHLLRNQAPPRPINATSIENACTRGGSKELSSTKEFKYPKLQNRYLNNNLSKGNKLSTSSRRNMVQPTAISSDGRKEKLTNWNNEKKVIEMDEEELENAVKHLPETKRLQIKELLNQYKNIFAINNSQPGTTYLIRHEINTEGAQPIAQAPYRSNPEKRKEIQRQVQSLLDAGQIEVSKSPWSSPVLLVPKKDGGWRMCVDYRKLNNVTKKVSYPIPRTEDTFDYLVQAKWFSKMDAASGFWQVPMEQLSKEKTAMITPDGLFQWKVMPFGLCNAPATFQKLMDVVLTGLKWKECLVYLDDILIFSKDWEEHLLHLKHVFERLEKARISLKLSKCEFAKDEIQFLGHIIRDQKILPDERNVAAVSNFPVPKNLTGLRGFLGLVGHYRRFISKFADKSQALRKLLKKGESFVWGEEQQKAYEELKANITSKPVLGLPDFSKPFRLSTDASNVGISAILSQLDEEGKEQYVIGYRSRALRGAEENYSTIEKEMLAIVFGLQKFDYYLVGSESPFEIVTDHQPLCHMPTTKDPYGRIGRWALLLQSYNYKIKHLPGQKNVVADVLSRFFSSANDDPKEHTPSKDEIQHLLQELVFVNTLRIEDSIEEGDTIFPKWFEGNPEKEQEVVCQVNVDNKKDWFAHWMLNPKVFKLIEEQWGPLHTDLFATESNRQIEKYYSKEDEPLSAGKDSFMQIWDVEGCYANPPWSLLDKTIRRIKEERLKVVVISPYWPNTEWFKLAVKMCACPPIILGRHWKLYLMNEGKSRGAARWSSVAWLLDGAIDGVENWNVGEPTTVLDWDTSGEPRLITLDELEETIRFNRVDYNKPLKPSIEPITNQRLAKSTFLELQEQDKQLEKAFDEVKRMDIPPEERSFSIHEGRLCRIVKEELVPGVIKPTLRLVIPKQIRKSVIYACHDDVIAGHLGYKRTLLRLQQRYWWPNMTNDVRWYVRSCRNCQFAKRDQGAKGGPLNPLPPRSEPFEVIGMDLIYPMPKSGDGNIAILVWEDYTTRWSEAIPLEDTSAATLGKAFWYNIVCRYGCPRTVLTDLGRNFMASMFEELLRYTKTSRLRTTAYHPQTDGLVERQNQTLKQMIRTYVNKNQDDWDLLLPYLSFAYNTSVHSATGSTPYFLLYGREATLPVDVALEWTPESQLNHGIYERMIIARQLAKENLISSQEYQRKRYDPRHGDANKFGLGDIVLVRMEFISHGRKKSIAPKFSQLAKVVGTSPGNVYKIRLGPKSYSWINVERLKKYYPSEEERRTFAPWLTSPEDNVGMINSKDEDEGVNEGENTDGDDI